MSNKALIGLLLILIGAVIILNSVYGIFDTFGQWWPLIVIFIGLIQIIKRSSSIITGLVITLFGLAFLLGNLNIIKKDLIFPVLLIIAGCWFIFGRGIGRKTQVSIDKINHFALFSNVDTINTSQDFKGGSVAAVFGGADINLRNAQLSENGASLELIAVFGGIDVFVPQGWNVKVSGIPLFGGWENKTSQIKNADGNDVPMLQVSCTAIFGGVTIKN